MTIRDIVPIEADEQAPWTSRTVILFDGSPIGVAPAAGDSFGGADYLTDEQRAAALEKAAAARLARGALKDRLKRGGTNLRQVLQDAETDEVLGKTKVSALLESLPKVGKVKAQEILAELEIAPARRLRGLGDRQRKALLEKFDDVGPGTSDHRSEGGVDWDVTDDDLGSVPRTRRRARNAPRSTRGKPPSEHSVPAAAQAYFHAETDDVITTTEESLVLVEISLEELKNSVGAKSQLEKRNIDAVKPITVNLIPRVNLAVVGDKSATVDPPHAGEPRSLTFRITGVQAGPGQLLVIAGQGPVDLVKMVLDVVVLHKKGQPQVAGPQRASVGAPIPPMPDAAACDQMKIDPNITVVGDKVVSIRFNVRYESESLDYRDGFETRPIVGDRLAYVNSLYSQIEADWGDSAADAETFNTRLRAYGGQLFDELIPGPIQKLLWDNRDTIKQIQLSSFDPLIPWEIVHLKQPDGNLPSEERFLASMGLVRWIDGAKYPPRQVNVATGSAKVLAPSYPSGSGWELSEPVNEYKFVNATFGATQVKDDVNTVMHLLESPGGFDLLHFAGHGMAKLTDIANAGLVIGSAAKAAVGFQ